MHVSQLILQLRQDAAIAPLLPALAASGQDGRWLPAHALLQAESLDAVLVDFAATAGHAGADRRAIASLWSRWHFGAVVPPFMAALMLHGVWPALAAVQLSDEHKSCRLRWNEDAELPVLADVRLACELPVHRSLALVHALASGSGASPKVFWSNLGNMLEYMLTQLRHHPQANPALIAAFDAMLAAPALQDGSPNPIYQPVRYLPDDAGDIQRIRRLCCLYYLLPGTELCSNCPRLRPHHKHRHVPT